MYYQASTQNPLGRRPWNSRLSGLRFYEPNTFAVPTAGRGPFLLNAGVVGRPSMNGGLSGPPAAHPAANYGQRFWWMQNDTGSMSLADDGDASTDILGVSVDPTLLGLGLVALLGAVYLFGGTRPKRKARRLRKRISRSQAQLRELQAV
jgi:hypothetical protein